VLGAGPEISNVTSRSLSGSVDEKLVTAF